MPTSIVGDPLFQLNLVLMTSWKSAPNGDVIPIFADAEYVVLFIERTIDLPSILYQSLVASGASIQASVSHDVFLDHRATGTLVPIECKRTSFGVASSTADQARSMLLLDATLLGDFVGITSSEPCDTLLTYVVSQGSAQPMLATLGQLSADLATYGASVSAYSSIDLCERPDGIYMQTPPGATQLPSLNLSQPILVLRLHAQRLPNVLYLIPYIHGGPDGPDQVAEDVLKQRLKAATIAQFAMAGRAQTIDLDDLLRTVVQIWDLWQERGMKGWLRRYSRDFIRDVFSSLRKSTGVNCSIRDRTITLPAMTSAEVARVRQYLIGASYRQQPMRPIGDSFQLPLGSILEDEGSSE